MWRCGDILDMSAILPVSLLCCLVVTFAIHSIETGRSQLAKNVNHFIGTYVSCVVYVGGEIKMGLSSTCNRIFFLGI